MPYAVGVAPKRPKKKKKYISPLPRAVRAKANYCGKKTKRELNTTLVGQGSPLKFKERGELCEQ